MGKSSCSLQGSHKKMAACPATPSHPDIIVDMDHKDGAGNKDIWDLTGYEKPISELRSYFRNRRIFSAKYPASSIILLLGNPGVNRLHLVQAVCSELDIVCIHVCRPPHSYDWREEEGIEYYLKQARGASEQTDVILYFDNNEVELMSKISDISSKISLVGAANNSASLNQDFLSTVSKCINIPPPAAARERIKFIEKKIEEANFTNFMTSKEVEFIDQETKKYTYKDMQRLWYQSCDILLSQLPNTDPIKNRGDEVGVEVVDDAPELKMTGEIMIKALAALSATVHHKQISEEEYFEKFSDFVEKKKRENKPAAVAVNGDTKHQDESTRNNAGAGVVFCMGVLAFVGIMIFLFSHKRPTYTYN